VKDEEIVQQYRLDSDTKKQLNSLLTTIEEADVKECFAMAVTDEEGLTCVYFCMNICICLTFTVSFNRIFSTILNSHRGINVNHAINVK
jgi:hypothetical protein